MAAVSERSWLFLRCAHGDKHEARDKAEMFEKSIERHEPVVPNHRPEIVGDQHGDRRQCAKRASAEPNEESRNDEQRATKLDKDSRARPEPAGVKAKVFLFGDGAVEIDKLVEATDEVRGNQR